MGPLKSLAAAAAILGAALTFSGAASAAPVSSAGLATGQPGGIVENVQWGYYGHRRYWGPRRYYGPRRFYGPAVVCRYRPSPWGPRRVCFRRW